MKGKRHLLWTQRLTLWSKYPASSRRCVCSSAKKGLQETLGAGPNGALKSIEWPKKCIQTTLEFHAWFLQRCIKQNIHLYPLITLYNWVYLNETASPHEIQWWNSMSHCIKLPETHSQITFNLTSASIWSNSIRPHPAPPLSFSGHPACPLGSLTRKGKGSHLCSHYREGPWTH